jgi:phosphoribosylformimino-5-aminoimidazole carboxamide ribotide isomerase
MILYPAVDLMAGEVVRLIEGDFTLKTIFARDPKELLSGFAADGAKFAHLVDLSGAKDPSFKQTALIASLIEQVPLKIQTGGGVRALEDIEALIAAGAERVVVGSLAVLKPEVMLEALEKFGPERLCLALDVRMEGGEPVVMTHGWTKSSAKTFGDVLAPYLQRGLRRVLCTDISVDGRMTGSNVGLYRSLMDKYPSLELQASGGVAKLSDLEALKKSGVHSVVIGRALLSGAFTLKEALAYAE